MINPTSIATLWIGFFSFLVLNAHSQDYSCNCRHTFDAMIEKLEDNYIAYHLTKSEIDSTYQLRKSKYALISNSTEPHHCSQLMQSFLSFFKDGHLFVTEYPSFSEEDLMKSKIEVTTNRLAVSNYVFSQNSIEGYWTDGLSKFAVLKNTNAKIPFEYIAVIVESVDTLKVGEIKFGVSETEVGWEGSYYTNNYSSRYVKVTPYKENRLLSIWGGITWGRLPTKDTPIYNPVETTIQRIDERNLLITIPSFLIDANEFTQILIDHLDELKNAENFIIDIRGNTGGNGIYFDLISFYYEKPAINHRGFAYSSADNMAYFEKYMSSNENDPYLSVVNAMKNNPSTIVQGPDFGPLELIPEPSKIKKVVILTDRGNMSAAETFILYSKAVSSKVIIMGEPTGGVVDYNNINLVKLNCTKHGIYFGYPTYTLHDKVLTNGYNRTGIQPDVPIRSEVNDKISAVVKYLNDNP